MLYRQILLLAILLPAAIHAQIRSATITGAVTDISGAAVAGADVSIANQETNITANIKTNEAGQFVFPYLPAGTYSSRRRLRALWHTNRPASPVTLPCGRVITPGRNTFLKYNACAFEGQIVRAPNGNFIADQYWVGNSAQNIGDLRGPGRFNIDLSLRRTFRIREGLTLNVNADATNLLNNPQYSGNYSGGLGATNLVDNAARGLKPGMGATDSFGTIGLGTFDPRQVTMRVLVRF